jgi:hypothetical protein
MKITYTEKQKERIDRFFKDKIPEKCPFCSSTNLVIGSDIVEICSFDPTCGYITGRPRTPLFQIKCENCYYLMLFNAIAIGIVDAKTGNLID